MPYDSRQMEEFAENYERWAERRCDVTTRIFLSDYRKDATRTLAAHGLVRRLETMARCMEQVFNLIPLDATRPSRTSFQDAAIFIQSFVINTYGSIDNLARMWVWETDLTKRNGSPLPQKWIGLSSGCVVVRESLSPPFQEYLATTDPWFDYLENYRHALAHRIPLYIPPKILDGTTAEQYGQLEHEMNIARQERDHHKLYELQSAQDDLGVFEPWMMHSYGPADNDGQPVRFHPQMICDIATVIKLTEKMMSELEALPKI